MPAYLFLVILIYLLIVAFFVLVSFTAFGVFALVVIFFPHLYHRQDFSRISYFSCICFFLLRRHFISSIFFLRQRFTFECFFREAIRMVDFTVCQT